MKVAVTVWEGHISPVFDVFREALILEVQGGQIVSRFTQVVEGDNPEVKVERLRAMGIDVVVCGAISQATFEALRTLGIRAISFVSGEVDTIVAALLAGRLPSADLAMPGCRGRHHRFRGGRGPTGHSRPRAHRKDRSP